MVETTPMKSELGSLPDLAQRIKTAHAAVLDASKNVVLKAISIGTDLIAAKKQMQHGMWLPWLKDNCGVSERHANRYMEIAAGKQKLAALKPDMMSDLTMAGALRIVQGKPPPEDDGTGRLGKYLKAQNALIEKKLKKLPPEDAEEAAQQTIAELQKFVPEKSQLAKAS